MDTITFSNPSPVISCDTPPLSTSSPLSDVSILHQKIEGLGCRVIRGSVPLEKGFTLRDQESDRRKECLTTIVKALSYKPAPSRELLLPIPIPLSDEKRDCLAAIKGLIAGEEKALSLDLKEWFLEISKMIAFAQLPFEAFIAQDPSRKNIFWLYEIYLATQTVSKKEVSTQFFDQYLDPLDFRETIRQAVDFGFFDALQQKVRELPSSPVRDKWVYQIAIYLGHCRRFDDAKNFMVLYSDEIKRLHFNQKSSEHEFEVLIEKDPTRALDFAREQGLEISLEQKCKIAEHLAKGQNYSLAKEVLLSIDMKAIESIADPHKRQELTAKILITFVSCQNWDQISLILTSLPQTEIPYYMFPIAMACIKYSHIEIAESYIPFLRNPEESNKVYIQLISYALRNGDLKGAMSYLAQIIRDPQTKISLPNLFFELSQDPTDFPVYDFLDSVPDNEDPEIVEFCFDQMVRGQMAGGKFDLAYRNFIDTLCETEQHRKELITNEMKYLVSYLVKVGKFLEAERYIEEQKEILSLEVIQELTQLINMGRVDHLIQETKYVQALDLLRGFGLVKEVYLKKVAELIQSIINNNAVDDARMIFSIVKEEFSVEDQSTLQISIDRAQARLLIASKRFKEAERVIRNSTALIEADQVNGIDFCKKHEIDHLIHCVHDFETAFLEIKNFCTDSETRDYALRVLINGAIGAKRWNLISRFIGDITSPLIREKMCRNVLMFQSLALGV